MNTLHQLTGCASERTFMGSHEAHIADYRERRRVERIQRESRAALERHLRNCPPIHNRFSIGPL